MSTRIEGLVLRIAGGVYQVDVGGEVLDCALRGRLKLDDEQVTAGDRVLLEPLPDGGCRIDRLLPRATRLSRRSVTGSREQVIVANVDQLAAVVALDRPAPDFRLLDRFLVLAEVHGLYPFIVLNKTDLAGAGGDDGPADGDPVDADPVDGDPVDGGSDGFDPYRGAGYEVLRTSAKRGDGVAELRCRLEGHSTVLAGPSGVGKSSLLNHLLPDQELQVREVSRKLGRGRHTTVGATMYGLPGGGHVADTPGLQLLVLWEIQPDELASAFPEFRSVIGDCRFADCHHLKEPDCAIRRLVDSDPTSERRYRSYVSLLEEAREGER